MTPQTTTAPKSAVRTYYSVAAGLIVNIDIGHRVIEPGGTTRMVDQKIAEFQPIGDGFGRLMTDDPQVIERMESRMGTHGDVFNGAEYLRRTTPAEIRLKAAELENKRLLEDHNRLLAKYAEEGKLPTSPKKA